MRIYLVMGTALALAACGQGRDAQSNAANVAATENMLTEQNMALDPMMNGTGNMAMDPAMNATANNMVDPATENAMKADMNTNDPDTNLANGL